MKTRRALVVVSCGLVLAGCLVSELRSATLEFVGGNVYSHAFQQLPPPSRRHEDWGDIPSGKTWVEAVIVVDYTQYSAWGFARGGAEVKGVGTSEIELTLWSETSGQSSEFMSVDLLGEASTEERGPLQGIYFQVVPSANEEVGEPGRLRFEWMAYGAAMGNVVGHVSGLALTKDDLPPTYPPNEIVWQHPDIGFSYEEPSMVGIYVGSVDYHIGDVFGLHQATLVHLEVGDYGVVESQMRLRIIPEQSTCWLAVACMLAMLVKRTDS